MQLGVETVEMHSFHTDIIYQRKCAGNRCDDCYVNWICEIIVFQQIIRFVMVWQRIF